MPRCDMRLPICRVLAIPIAVQKVNRRYRNDVNENRSIEKRRRHTLNWLSAAGRREA
jgi:hypothetical protein